jgi:hypothetical protein
MAVDPPTARAGTHTSVVQTLTARVQPIATTEHSEAKAEIKKRASM